MGKDMNEVIEELGKDFYEFKKDFKTRVETIEKRAPVPGDLEERLEKIATNVASLEGVKQQLDAKQETIDELKRRADEMEERLNTPIPVGGGKSILPKEIREKTIEYFRTGRPDVRAEVNEKLAELGKSLNLTVAEEGAVFYSVTEDSAMIPLVRETTPMRQIATVKSIGTSAWSGRRKTGVSTGGWVGEREARTETTAPTYAALEIPAHEMYAEPWITQTMLEDSMYDIESDLNADVAETLSLLQNAAFVTGNGVKKPRGFLTYDTSTTPTNVQLEYVPTGADGDWAASNPYLVFDTMIGKFKAGYLTDATWLMGRLRLAEVMRMIDGNNLPVWQPSLQAGIPSVLRGYRVTLAEDMPAKASGSYSAAFGNFKRGYYIIDRRGMRVVRDALTSKPYVKFYTTARVGGDVVDHSAIKVFKFSST